MPRTYSTNSLHSNPSCRVVQTSEYWTRWDIDLWFSVIMETPWTTTKLETLRCQIRGLNRLDRVEKEGTVVHLTSPRKRVESPIQGELRSCNGTRSASTTIHVSTPNSPVRPNSGSWSWDVITAWRITHVPRGSQTL